MKQLGKLENMQRQFRENQITQDAQHQVYLKKRKFKKRRNIFCLIDKIP